VSGYGSTFNNIDLGNDIVMPGAFSRTLAAGGKVRFLHSHDPRMVLGVAKNLREDGRGLFGEFKISRTKLGEDTRQLLKDGALDSFSIGYIAKDYDWDKKGDIRQLKDVELLEVSLVSMPMNPEAVVTGLKSYFELLGIETPDGESPTLAEQAKTLQTQLNNLLGDTRALLSALQDKDRPLTHTKRNELDALLATFAGLDAVRSDIVSVLAAIPTTGVAEARRLRYEMDQHRKRLAHILQER
jgi:HK97 family phage prohead protease